MDTEEIPLAPNGTSPFERIRRTNAAGAEHWSSRDFAQVLGYSDYRNFEQVVKRAKTACLNSGQRIVDHFVEITEMIESKTMCKGLSPAESMETPAPKRRKEPQMVKQPPNQSNAAGKSNREGKT
jgi:hypothetical protein